jgi:tripartite-type tricarboxylate transporter receptor subunit TctC
LWRRREHRRKSSAWFIANIVASPEFNDRLLALGFDPVASAPDQFADWIKIEIAKWGEVIREAGITLQ